MDGRILALDVGDRRIGLAASDPLGFTAQPAGVIERIGWGPDVRRIAEAAARYGTTNILCGLPRNMDGSLGPQAQKVRTFAQTLTQAGFTVVFWDERMSTVSAERALIAGGVRRKARKAVVDQTAAAIFLQAYLDAQRRGDKNGTG